ncbi:tip elongation aberrant protein 1 [Thalassophryne amazonica]|uniref:tip elongation aberrant protein 1 n=1 Tax=Thalassophryne amazonica TaxID=390379 RepID=UPI001471E0DD|nr:tip elongation aberrant protein 1 [Thalassophryne amazonica]
MNFYVLWSLRDAPRQFSRKSNRRCFQVHIPLPLPKQLVIFGFGEWKCDIVTVEVVVSADVTAQRIGTLSSQVRCLTWEGEWSDDVMTVAAERGRRGVYGKIVLTMCGEDNTSSIFSSTPLARGKRRLFPEQNMTDLSCTLHQNAGTERITPSLSGEVCSEVQHDTHNSKMESTLTVWPTTQVQAITSQSYALTWSSEEADSPTAHMDKPPSPKKKVTSRRNIQEEMDYREVRPSKRWHHAMCLSDADEAVLIGGETSEENCCKDSVWKLHVDENLWFPMNSSTSGPVPPSAQGHSATYDPDSKAVYVYGGLREFQRFSQLYVLDTLTWKWKRVTARGNVPALAYHSAVFYKGELFVFGGIQLSLLSGDKACSNALYIFNPEFELWYQPIVEGEKPLPRFGHSATLISDKLIIFGGQKTATYLNDLHLLDLGFMEYTAVKCGNMPPLPRGFHAALPVSDNTILVSGGCSTVGVLQDVHIFNTDTNMWSSVASPLLSSRPRAGHSMISLGCTSFANTEKQKQGDRVTIKCRLLVFGGSDCSGSFYDDTVTCTVEISGET